MMITAEHIGMEYRRGRSRVVALEDVSFGVEKGEIFGIIGPDGAGKSSLFRILTTLLLPTTGKATVGGFDVMRDYKALRSIVGYMPGRFSLYQDLSVEENLHFFARVFNTTVKENYGQVHDIYEQLAPFKKRRAGALSGGMKQKLALCCALIHRPEVLFLDEPTTGVDPVSREEFWQMLKRLRQQGISILVSTPYMDEAKQCDRIGLMFDGKLFSINTPDELVRGYDRKLLAVRSRDMYHLLEDTREEVCVHSCFTFGDYLHVALKAGGYSVGMLEANLKKKGYADLEVKEVQAGIEDCFMNLIN